MDAYKSPKPSLDEDQILSPFDRFNFEQSIMKCWNITTDIDDITNMLSNIEFKKPSDKDDVMNMLIGLSALYNYKFSQLFDEFEIGVRVRKIM